MGGLRVGVLLLLFLALPSAVLAAPVAAANPEDKALGAIRLHVEKLKQSGALDTAASDWRQGLSAPPQVQFSPRTYYDWILETSEGTVRFRLLPEEAPQHVANIIYLTEIGFYEDLPLDRVSPGFMFQVGGCCGGPRYKLPQEGHPEGSLERTGALAMGTNGDQSAAALFFVTLGPAPHLAGRNTVFGRIVAGMDVLRRIESLENASAQVKILNARVEAQLDPLEVAQRPVQAATDRETSADGDPPSTIPPPPQLRFPAGLDYLWVLETNRGELKIRLRDQAAPQHTSNIVYLTLMGYYDGQRFGRVVPGFMAQAGSPPAGKPKTSYNLDHESLDSSRLERRGSVAMGTGGSQSASNIFFISFVPTPWLDGKHTLVGQVVEGLEALHTIEKTGNKEGPPTEETLIEAARIEVVPSEFTTRGGALEVVGDFIRLQQKQGKIPRESPGRAKSLPIFPEIRFTGSASYYWNLETSEGPLRILLFPEVAPRHVASVLYLSAMNYYDGLSFHRVIPGFMAQGGRSPSGGPGYTFGLETDPAVRHSGAGILSTANTGRKDSDSAEFFITFRRASFLDGKYTISGRVVEGMETVRALEKYGSRSGKTTKPLTIVRAWVTAE